MRARPISRTLQTRRPIQPAPPVSPRSPDNHRDRAHPCRPPASTSRNRIPRSVDCLSERAGSRVPRPLSNLGVQVGQRERNNSDCQTKGKIGAGGEGSVDRSRFFVWGGEGKEPPATRYGNAPVPPRAARRHPHERDARERVKNREGGGGVESYSQTDARRGMSQSPTADHIPCCHERGICRTCLEDPRRKKRYLSFAPSRAMRIACALFFFVVVG